MNLIGDSDPSSSKHQNAAAPTHLVDKRAQRHAKYCGQTAGWEFASAKVRNASRELVALCAGRSRLNGPCGAR